MRGAISYSLPIYPFACLPIYPFFFGGGERTEGFGYWGLMRGEWLIAVLSDGWGVSFPVDANQW